MSVTTQPDPLREALSSRPIPEPCALVIFGPRALQDAIRAGWDSSGDDLASYAAGSWGTYQADELIKASGAIWRRL